ncbi:hypothetical protein M409DRAFT_65888 [Zasmidium cellare ATCC 36951]|uniref:tRNA (guanine(26)-N(2))-dimethyltransferase n=1 Tax=Zasmidium cellare ATCC 36951 TaxID=1080233 RepID=A0A6A6CL71_ZASCE|nr:uncharacterized protein M409DRAFT_65888 [Zasmidium cellare ATCC 36951]KAF2167791.1 hypothetical protein M409DRAFT_65888 [Zasmidium cellare ATCC 36951]
MASRTGVPITSPPLAGQSIEHEGKTYETVREGHAYILIPPNTQKSVDPRAKAKAGEHLDNYNVFYNPIQQFNRDLSVLSIKAFGEDYVQRRRQRNEKNKEKNNSKRNNKKRKITEVTEDNNDQEGGAEDGEVVKDEKNGEAANGEDTNSHPPQPAGPRFRILDALSATGLRALRYAKEIRFATGVVANDMNPNATKSMALNIQHNDLAASITPNTGDAIGHMYSVAYPPTNSHGPHHVNAKYDVIDLDPYGTAAPFIDAALQALNDGGLLCVTCTDSGVFASTGYCEKTYALYGGMPVKGPFMHEGGLRLIINSIASAAARYGLAIEPLLSLNIDFYARVFIRVRKSAADVKFYAGKTMLVYCCDSGCGAWSTNLIGRNSKQTGKGGNEWYKHSIEQAPKADRLCEHCGNKTHLGGPMWAGPLHNAAFIEKILEDLDSLDDKVYETKPRIEGMLTTALDELLVNDEATQYAPAKQKDGTAEMISKVSPEVVDRHPFFFNASALSKILHCIAPSDTAIKGALRHAGYRVTRSHCAAGSIKTNAPWTVIWEVMREWVRQKQPIKEGALREGQAGWRIMQMARKPEEETNGTSDGDTPEIVTEHTSTAMKDANAEPKRIKVVFDEVLGKDKPSAKRIVRYQQNPRENWGPMTKAKGSA